MRFLLDTNVLIPLEPGADAPVSLSIVAAEFHEMTLRGHHELLLHPAHVYDLRRDDDEQRRERTRRLASKYPALDRAPTVGSNLIAVLGSPNQGSNDWVDNQLLAALDADAIDYVVTEDLGIHRKAARLELGPRVATIAEAAVILRNLFDRSIATPPAVDQLKTYELDMSDPIFGSVRSDYPEFDRWITGVRREGRDCWVVHIPGSRYAAVAIVKREDEIAHMRGKILKISTLKVGEDQRGRHYGELLLKTLFEYARENTYDAIYVTVYPRHEELVKLLGDFGFRALTVKPDGELVLLKDRKPALPDGVTDLEYHIRYGPPAVRRVTGATHLVPIRPEFHRMLFPEQELRLRGGSQLPLLDRTDQPYGNALRKAYLSRAAVRSLEPGGLLLFYRSGDIQAVTTLGIVEAWQASADPDRIAQFVGKRTVYSYPQIQRMAADGEVLAVLFRQDRVFDPPLDLSLLLLHEVVKGPPQSISQANMEGLPWLARLIVE